MSKKATAPANHGVKKDKSLRAKKALTASRSSADQGELSDAELDSVSGGTKPAGSFLMKSCATGSHFKEATITH